MAVTLRTCAQVLTALHAKPSCTSGWYPSALSCWTIFSRASAAAALPTGRGRPSPAMARSCSRARPAENSNGSASGGSGAGGRRRTAMIATRAAVKSSASARSEEELIPGGSQLLERGGIEAVDHGAVLLLHHL